MKFERLVKETVHAAFLLADIGPRYWEDASVDGQPDDDDSPRMPLVQNGRWYLKIDLHTGLISNWPAGVTASTHYKVCDDGFYALQAADGTILAKRDGYVPKMLCPKESGYGDYVIMDINGGGRIVGWQADLSYFAEAQP